MCDTGYTGLRTDCWRRLGELNRKDRKTVSGSSKFGSVMGSRVNDETDIPVQICAEYVEKYIHIGHQECTIRQEKELIDFTDSNKPWSLGSKKANNSLCHTPTIMAGHIPETEVSLNKILKMYIPVSLLLILLTK
ncbi:zinc finger protein 616, partial [Biomphalaria pfeifferi]